MKKFRFTGRYIKVRQWILLMGLIFSLSMQAQLNSGVQLNLSGGISQPVSQFNDLELFAGQGRSLSGGLDYYFFKGIGLGIEGGFFDNLSKAQFESLIFQKYLVALGAHDNPSWQTKYIFGGPTIKWSPGRFEMDFTGKIGVAQITGPKLLYGRDNFGQYYDVYRFTIDKQDWGLAWNTGIRAIYKLNDWIGIQVKADYWTSKFFDKIDYSYSYKDVLDLDRNGYLDDEEFYEANTILNKKSTTVNVVNLNLGLVFQFGNISKIKNNEVAFDGLNQTPEGIKLDDEDNQVKSDSSFNQVDHNTMNTDINPSDIIKDNDELTLRENEVSHDSIKSDDILSDAFLTDNEQKNEIYEKVKKTAILDSLYSAGEYNFINKDYPQAADYFGQLKDEKDYPRAGYMYALSLSFMGKCSEAKKEFKEFKKSYSGDDLRSLEVLFISQFENCAAMSNDKMPLTETKAKKESKEDQVATTTKILKKEYQVQFIAIRHPNALFMSVGSIDKIRVEYINDKKLYRYSLGGYVSMEEALKDLKHVRAKGYKDAFIALYENGKRVDTMYHDGDEK